MSAEGNYITDSDVDNWAVGAIDAEKLAIIQEVEADVERITKDFFYPRAFDVYRDGNNSNRMNLGFSPDILHISSIELAGVTMTASTYTWDRNSVFLKLKSTSNSSVELAYLLRQHGNVGIFPKDISLIRFIGTYGWPEKLSFDNSSGTFENEETITGGTSGATAIIKRVESDYLLIVGRSSDNFQNNEEITGGTSAATADVNSASGAINNPPLAIKEACIILCRHTNDETLYEDYIEGMEGYGSYAYSSKGKIYTGVREADKKLRRYVRRKARMAIV